MRQNRKASWLSPVTLKVTVITTTERPSFEQSVPRRNDYTSNCCIDQ